MEKAVCHNKAYMCIFGGEAGKGNDIVIYNDCHIETGSYANLGHTYELKGMTYGSEQAKSYLGGSY